MDQKQKRQEGMIRELQEEPELNTYFANLSPEKQKRIKTSAARRSNGLYAAAPLTCVGPKGCPFHNHCPIADRDSHGRPIPAPINDYPVGRPCVLETSFVRNKVLQYIQHLDVDPANPVEMAMVEDLAIIDLYKQRALLVMSEGDVDSQGRDLLKQDTTGYTDGGAPLKSTQLHPAVDAIDRFEKRRLLLLDRLLETRKAKLDTQVKLGAGPEDSKVLEELRKIRQYMDNAQLPVVDEELLIED